MSSVTNNHGDKNIHSSKRQKTATSFVSMPAGGHGGDESSDENGHKDTTLLKPRAYQLEMLEESLRQNVIIAMETGSGKTQIAVLRIRAELERCPAHKIVWFIAPTVVLAQQQYNVISQQLSSFEARIITGADNVDHWSSDEVWNTVLLNVRIVVSTPQVLLDALAHAFVRLSQLALLVIDEAHHCVRAAPAHRILKDFYHYHRQQPGSTDKVPHILGLTASPTSDGSERRLSMLEESLNAVCRTPKVNREEMMQFVNLPQTEVVYYDYHSAEQIAFEAKLDTIVQSMNVEDDPFVKRLRVRDDEKSKRKLQAALNEGKTVCRKQIRTCFDRALTMRKELGPWAADTFLAEIRRRLQGKFIKGGQQMLDESAQWDYEDNLYMLKTLKQVHVPQPRECWDTVPDDLAPKAQRLVHLLENTYVSSNTTAIVFAKERATVIMLAHLISMHPRLKHVKGGPFLGNSGYETRKSHLVELVDSRDQADSVNQLRAATKNLLVSTSVLEEGVDVPACDLVICFDPPANLRAFIQRRGRARKEKSRFIIFFSKDDVKSIGQWQKSEMDMKKRYEDDMRVLKLAEERESVEEEGYEGMRIPSTGALLTLDNARGHLEHFCATLSRTYTSFQPDFVISGEDDRLTAKVLLPNVLDPQFRLFNGRTTWKTEKMAKRDAAFQAYAALYHAGLVNHNLLPSHTLDYKNILEDGKRTSFAEVSSPLKPWVAIAAQWASADCFYQTIVEITSGTHAHAFPQMIMVLPIPLPYNISFPLYWNEDTTATVLLRYSTGKFAPDLIELARTTTHILLNSNFASRMVAESMDFSCLFVPKLNDMSAESIRKWCESAMGTIPASGISKYDTNTLENLGLVRRLNKFSRYEEPLIAEKSLWMKRVLDGRDAATSTNDAIEGVDAVAELHLEGQAWPKRTDFLHPVMNIGIAKPMHTARRCHPASDCLIDKLPTKYARFAKFIPCILHTIGNHLIVQELRKTILAPVAFQDLNLVLAAISASSAQEVSDYQRLEFLGDCQLKLHTSLQLAAKNPTWHEELLSRHKDAIVSNTRLSRAAKETGLHQFILLKAFTGAKWRPIYNSDQSAAAATGKTEPTRQMSTKTLADVVEALIGAATVDGGQDKALKCLRIFLPEVKWDSYESRLRRLNIDAESDTPNTQTSTLKQVEDLIGHEFTKKSLLQAAFTHPSCPTPGLTYQRLEFIGDSVLDAIVVKALFDSPKDFPHDQMHLMRTALVNADFLAFLAMNTSADVLRGDVASISEAINGDEKMTTITTKTTVRHVALWQYMRHSHSLDILQNQQRASNRFKCYRADITKALETSRTYPWTLLSHVGADKFFSDLIESILGAILIDSGSIDACHPFLERIGLMKYLRRVLDEDIDVMHPKERLGMLAAKKHLKVEYQPERTGQDVSNGAGDEKALEENNADVTARWKCSLRVGGEEVAHAEGALSRFHAESKAAEAAIATMEMADVDIVDEPRITPDENDDEEEDEIMAELDVQVEQVDDGWMYVLD